MIRMALGSKPNGPNTPAPSQENLVFSAPYDYFS